MSADTAALERIEIEAMRDLWHAASQDLRIEWGVSASKVGGGHCFRCRDLQPTLMFRRVVGLGVEREATAGDLDAIERHMTPGGQPWAVAVVPFARPASLPEWLAARGYVPGYAWMKFRRACVPTVPPATDLHVRVLDEGDGDAFATVVAEAYGLPPAAQGWVAALPGRARWVCVAAFDGRQAVGAGAVFVDGEHAWLGFGATLPAYRRRGAQAALLARRIEEAAARGTRIAVTETGERVPDKPSNSYRNILRAGFEEAYLRRHVIAPSS